MAVSKKDTGNPRDTQEYFEQMAEPSAASAGSLLIDEMASMLRDMKRWVSHNTNGHQCYGCEVTGNIDRLLARYEAGEQ